MRIQTSAVKKNRIQKNNRSIWLVIAIALSMGLAMLTGCATTSTGSNEVQPEPTQAEDGPTENGPTEVALPQVQKGEYYYDVENVTLYIDTYGELPDNYITKSEAQALGWSGGSVEKYREGAAIGGDRFGNYEGILPEGDDIRYTECDIDTHGASGRGAKRLIFSNDGNYYYTEDHYESFCQVFVMDGEIVYEGQGN